MPVLLHMNTYYSLTRQVGNSAIVHVPGLCGGNVTMCAAIGHRGVIHHHAQLGPYNTALLLTFLDALNNILIPPQEEGPEQPNYVVIWDDVSFHLAALVHIWFANIFLYLPPYSSFLNLIEGFFSEHLILGRITFTPKANRTRVHLEVTIGGNAPGFDYNGPNSSGADKEKSRPLRGRCSDNDVNPGLV
ncbi:hypothetical protein N1851_021671 [Merluccius polli]|uniref:Tc1-like transposase DDE domain-containing protein n=1 Tax=Merluccius polli TaxID=89951 RepID=A0AA47MJR4_MERPO|nr:hypothetical protein N1851_021671 [Merluccius polli]